MFSDRRSSEHLTHLHRFELRIDVSDLVSCQTDIGGSGILLQAGEMTCAWDGDDPRTFVDHPCQRDLRWRGMMLIRQLIDEGKELPVLIEALFAELRHGGAIIRLGIEM